MRRIHLLHLTAFCSLSLFAACGGNSSSATNDGGTTKDDGSTGKGGKDSGHGGGQDAGDNEAGDFEGNEFEGGEPEGGEFEGGEPEGGEVEAGNADDGGGTGQTDGGKIDGGSAEGGKTDGGGAEAGKTDGGAAAICSAGTLFAGNPTYAGQPSDRPTSGTGILANPPFQWQNLLFAGTDLYSRDEGELWVSDLSAATPVETHVVGMNDPANFAYAAGPCATALFGQIRGLAALSNGSIVVADALGNGVLLVTTPTTASCTVAYLAGNSTAGTDLDPSEDLPDTGDAVGPGAMAKFNGPKSVEVDANDNIYVFDSGNNKIKKIANDAAHTVTTLATVKGPDTLFNLTHIGNTLYAIGTSQAGSGYVLGYDMTSGAVTTVLKGDGDSFPPLDSYTFPDISGISTDGTGLYISGSGYVWYLTLAGKLKLVAGTGVPVDFPPSGYNAANSHPALKLALPEAVDGSSVGAEDYITFSNGALYFRGSGAGTAAFIERIACP